MENKMAMLGLSHQYARLAGTLIQLQLLESQQRAAAEPAALNLAATEDQIAEVSQKLETIRSAAKAAFGADLSSVAPRRTIPKDHRTGWGQITRSVLKQLAQAKGTPLTTIELAARLNRSLDLGLDDDGLRRLAVAVRYCLKRLNRRGLVVRVSAAESLGAYSTWAVADSAE